ncbi:unnamed protein product [Moneuplotes crassus]|uniref:Uncharacterized protein n=1 Tax=Euplotes crassus TaxID=5936 RepID=A0AAD1UDD4_EUPCR|nr:unnamed protein product [Moneuplotes crassus]
MSKPKNKSFELCRDDLKAIREFLSMGGDLRDLISSKLSYKKTKKLEDEYKRKANSAFKEIFRDSSNIKHKPKGGSKYMFLYEQTCKQVEALKRALNGSQHRNEILEDEINKLRLKEAEYNSQNKDNEISEIYKNTENIIQQEVSKYEQKFHMKEEECARLKQILYTKEDIIRKISVAYEQSKADEDSFQDQLDHYKSQISELEKMTPDALMAENMNLKEQNKQLIITLIDYFTKPRSRKRSKRKKNTFSGTLMNINKLRKSAQEHSRRRLSRRKKGSQRKSSSKKRSHKDRVNLSHLNHRNQFIDLPDTKRTPLNSIKNMSKKRILMKTYKNPSSTTYQSYDPCLLNSTMNQEILHSGFSKSPKNLQNPLQAHHHSVKTPQDPQSTPFSLPSKPRATTTHLSHPPLRREAQIPT